MARGSGGRQSRSADVYRHAGEQGTGRSAAAPRGVVGAVAIFAAMLVVPALLAWLALQALPGAPPPLEPSAPVAAPPPPEDVPSDEVPARRVYGQVTGPDGVALPGVAVAHAARPRRTVLTDAQGRYELALVPVGETELTFVEPAHLAHAERLAAGAAGERVALDVRLTLAPDVGGTVVDAGGEPAPGATVACAEGEEVVADEDGRFTLPPDAAGCTAIARHGQAASSVPATLRPGDRNVLRLREAASIAGRVVDAQNLPVVAYRLSVESYLPLEGEGSAAGGRFGDRRGPVSVEANDGTFELAGLAPGRYVLAVAARGLPAVTSDPIELGEAERHRGVHLVLAAGETLVGKVVDADTGEPITSARLVLDGQTMSQRGARARSGDDGRFSLEGVPAGPFSVHVRAEGYRSLIAAGLSSRAEARVELHKQGADGATMEYAGIGATLTSHASGTALAGVMDGGPAAEAGLRAGDRLVRIDGLEPRTLGECLQRLRGPDGTRVRISVWREGTGELDVVVTRAHLVL